MRWSLNIETRYEYDPNSNRPPILEGIASRTTMDSEGDVICSFDEDSLEYLCRWGKLDYNHNGVAIGQILDAKIIHDEELSAYLKKSYGVERASALYIVGQLFPLTNRAHPDLKEVYYLISSKAKIGFSIEGRPSSIEQVGIAKSKKRLIHGLKLHPRVAVTPTPVHPEAGVVLVKSFAHPGWQGGMKRTCVACAYTYLSGHDDIICPSCNKLTLPGG